MRKQANNYYIVHGESKLSLSLDHFEQLLRHYSDQTGE